MSLFPCFVSCCVTFGCGGYRYHQNKGTLAEARERLKELTAEKDKIINDIQVIDAVLTRVTVS